MDLVTQVVFGAAVGEVVLGKKAGNKAILWGAIGGLIPDLDVLVTPFYSDVDGLFVHRGFSHSILFSFLLAPLIGWLAYLIHRKSTAASKTDWMKVVFWAAFTHPILDYMTTYGTAAFWPFSDYRVEFSHVGIVDLFYTLPLILVLVVIMFMNRSSLLRRKLIVGVVLLTTVYLGATAVNKLYVNTVFEKAYADNNIEYERFRTTALPLTNFLWMGLAETDSGYYMGLYSNFDSEKPKEFIFIARNHEKLQKYADDEGLQKLIKFTKGWYHVDEDQNGLYLVDLRFGKAGLDKNADYIFKFNLEETDGPLRIQQSTESRSIEADAFNAFIDRIRGVQ